VLIATRYWPPGPCKHPNKTIFECLQTHNTTPNWAVKAGTVFNPEAKINVNKPARPPCQGARLQGYQEARRNLKTAIASFALLPYP
jgi:hypothetical protein